jgi:hypothetical protein
MIHVSWEFHDYQGRNGPELPLALLTPLVDPAATDWLCASLTTFAENVSSFLPGNFPAYARVYHPFDSGADSTIATLSWRELAARAGRDFSDPATATDFAYCGVPDDQARPGSASPGILRALVEHLRPATTTSAECYFAVWEGFAGAVVPPLGSPQLELPNRVYNVFVGPVEAALTSLDPTPWCHRSPSLWWPADHAWCVATEVDSAWTYVGGPRTCIDAVLADPRLDSVETSAQSRW